MPLLVVLLVVAGIAVPFVLALAGGEDDPSSAGDSESALREFRDGRSGTAEEGFLSPDGTKEAFARLKAQAKPGERITSLSIRPEYLSAQLATGEGAPERSLTIRSDDGDDHESASSSPSSSRGIALEALDLRGPAALMAAARRGLGPASPATTSYVVLDLGRTPDDPSGWAVYLEGTTSENSRWTSDMRGEHVLRPSDGAPAPPEGERGPATVPTGVGGASMVRPENLRRAIAVVRDRLQDGALVTSVDVRPRTVTFRVRRSFRERTYTVDAAFGLDVGDVNETSSRDGVALSSVNWRGPERALRKVDSRQENRAPERVDYVILSPRSSVFAQSRTVWLVYLQGGHPNGRYWRATADGKRIGRSGEPGAP